MSRQAVIRKRHLEKNNNLKGSLLRDFILGWQDGLVNVLTVILGVATAAPRLNVILVAAFAAAFGESLSMAAVAYTSFKSERDFYSSEVNREKKEMKTVPEVERGEIYDVYHKLGFRGSLLKKIVQHVTANKRRWLQVMMKQELELSPSGINPMKSSVVVGLSALIGSLIPVAPFLFLPIKTAVVVALVFSAIVLFFVGIYKAKTTVGNIWISGLQMVAIGMVSAFLGWVIGLSLGYIFP